MGRACWSLGWPIRRPSLCLPLDALTHTLLTVPQGVEELQNRVTAGRHSAFFLGLTCLNCLGLFCFVFLYKKKPQHLDRICCQIVKNKTNKQTNKNKTVIGRKD